MRRIDLDRAQVARSNTVRGINRYIVLNYVRERGPISRAEIARETDLQRSTISLIVEDLKTDGLIEEVGSGESTGGRPPSMLHLRTSNAIAIGVAITPSRTTIATSDLAGRVLERDEFATDPKAEKTVARVVEGVHQLVKRHKGCIEGIGVSIPGVVDPATGIVNHVPYFKWRDLKIADEIRAATKLPVMIENDASAAALAELWFGSRDVSHLRDIVVVLVHEGVGTGIVFDGQLYRGATGGAGEFGHMIIGSEAPVVCSCGNRNCWEAFSCERAAVARYLTSSPLAKVRRTVSYAQLVDLALAGDEAARSAILQTAYYLGIGIINLAVGLSPEAVVVTGTIVNAWSLIAESLDELVRENAGRGLTKPVPIIASTLGADATLMGALSLVLISKFAFESAA